MDCATDKDRSEEKRNEKTLKEGKMLPAGGVTCEGDDDKIDGECVYMMMCGAIKREKVKGK